MKKRTRKTERSSNKKLAGFGSGSQQGSKGRPMTVKSLAKFMQAAMGHSVEESEARAEFYILFGYPAGKESVKDIKEEIERRKKWEEKKAAERNSAPSEAPRYESSSSSPASSSSSNTDHSCSHHCYHTSPPELGLRADTYGATTCCGCGTSAPNPWDNERR